jgi:hypothetical protein
MFPLFDTIYQETEAIQSPLQYEEKMELCNEIKDLDQEGFDLVYAIIRTFYLAKENGHYEFVPYSPKINKTGYKFDTTFLPPRLLIMIRHFVTLHRNKLKEESLILDLQSKLTLS